MLPAALNLGVAKLNARWWVAHIRSGLIGLVVTAESYGRRESRGVCSISYPLVRALVQVLL